MPELPRQCGSLLRAAVFLCVGACSASDDDFESYPKGPTTPPPPSTQIAGFPEGWAGGTANPGEYELGRDVGVQHGGRVSVYIRNLSQQTSPNSFMTLTQSLRADRVRGKRVRLAGYLRVAGVTGDGVALWFRGDGAKKMLAFDNMEGRRRTGTEDWRLAEIVVDVPAEVVGFAFGVFLAGPGVAWADDLRLDVVDSTVPLTAPAVDTPVPGADSAGTVAYYNRLGTEPLNLDFEGVVYPESMASTIDWVRSHSLAFLTDDPEAGDADLAPLGPLIGSAGIVAMGEGTHGTREFFRMKHRVFSWLVRNHGFTRFGIEASLPEALAVDRYVQTGIGDPATLVRGMGFWTWSTDEVFELVRWMRQWNANGGEPRVHFNGFDMQAPGAAMDSVIAFASGIDAPLGDTVRAAYDCLGPYRNLGTRAPQYEAYRRLDPSEQDACRASLASVDSLFAHGELTWAPIAGAARTSLMKRLARLVSQWEDYSRQTFGGATAARDRYMAENVAWWRSQSAGARTMLWAHNFHVSRSSPWMGSHLDAAYGSDYVNAALTFSGGSFNAVLQLPSGAFAGIATHSLGNAMPSSIEAVFDATGMSQAILDARAIGSGGSAADPLKRRLTMRSIGSTFAPTALASAYQAILALPEDYDLVVWFRATSRSRISLSTSNAVRLTNWPD